jgi:hypothetical protein
MANLSFKVMTRRPSCISSLLQIAWGWVLTISLASVKCLANEGDFPSFDPGFSLETARAAVIAYVREWSEDDQSIESDLSWNCFMAGVDSVAKPIALPSVALLLEIDSYLLRRDREGKLLPGRVLQEPIERLLASLELMPIERSRADDLKLRVAQSLADRLKLAADSQWFLMEISERVFAEHYREHLSRTEGWVGFLRYYQEKCKALQVRRDRNQSLTRAAKRVLALYAFLERESGKSFPNDADRILP